MAAKVSFVLCATTLLVQSVYSACLGGLSSPFGFPSGFNALAYEGFPAGGLAYEGLGYGCGCAAGVASTGGGLAVSSASPIAPVGVSVLSENVYEGALAAGGNLPFLGTVGIEGVLPTAGAGAVSYGCGDGLAAIASEGPLATGIAAPAVFAPASPSTLATADAKAMCFNGLAGKGFAYNGIGYNGLGGLPAAAGLGALSPLGYNPLSRAGCGCGAFI